MRTLMVICLSLTSSAAGAQQVDGGAPPEVLQETTVAGPCDDWVAPGLPEGPATLATAEADFQTGRRACPRTEIGLGARFGAIIDTAHFYGNLGLDALLFGSLSLDWRTEIYATMELVSFNYVQTALKATSVTLGDTTLGATRVLYGQRLIGAFSARVLLPTSFEVPGVRPIGLEAGHATTFRANRFIEIHTWLAGDLTVGLSASASDPRVGATAAAGVQISPWSWLSVVADISGRIGAVTALAPTVALRARIASLGVELGGSLPVLGTDRHDFVGGARFTWRL